MQRAANKLMNPTIFSIMCDKTFIYLTEVKREEKTNYFYAENTT